LSLLDFSNFVDGTVTLFNNSGFQVNYPESPVTNTLGFWLSFLEGSGIIPSPRQYITDMSLMGTPGYFYGDFSPKDVPESITDVRYRRHMLYSL
jgi:hypothetical protein